MVLKETPAAADAAAGVKTRSNTCFTTRSRPNGVNRAFLCTFIGGSLRVLTSWRHQLRLTAFNEQPIEKSQLDVDHLARHAAVEQVVLPGGEARGVRDQERHQLCNIRRPADAPHGVLRVIGAR